MDRRTVLQELDQCHLLTDVLEVGAHHRIERLLDQLLHVAEALDDHRRFLVVDVHDDRERQRRLEGVLGDQRDLRQVLVQLHRSDFAPHPFENEVDGRNHLDLAGVGVERVFAGQQGVVPHAPLPHRHQLAVLVVPP